VMLRQWNGERSFVFWVEITAAAAPVRSPLD